MVNNQWSVASGHSLQSLSDNDIYNDSDQEASQRVPEACREEAPDCPGLGGVRPGSTRAGI